MRILRKHKPGLLIESFEPPAVEGSASNSFVKFLASEGYEPWVFSRFRLQDVGQDQSSSEPILLFRGDRSPVVDNLSVYTALTML